jgi:hypothetical protein
MAVFSGSLLAQPFFVDEFDDGTVVPDTDKFDITEVNGEMVVMGNGTNGDWDGVWFQLPQTVDVSASPKLYVRAKSSILGTTLRMDLAGPDGTFTNITPITQTLTDNYRVLEYDFSTVDNGDFDFTQVQAIFFFVNPGAGAFTGQVSMDYFALGEDIEGPITSDIYQDQMDTDSSLTNFSNEVVGFTRERSADGSDPSFVTFVGDGTAGPWTPHVYALRPAPEFIQTSVDMTDNPKMFVKMRSSVPGTAIRIDVQDTDGIASIGNAITRILTDEFVVYEFDYTDAFHSFPTESCPTADVEPCDVNLEAIGELLMFVNGGTGMFSGTIDFDWISFGTNLDGAGPEAALVYQDHFDNERLDFTGSAEGVAISESGSSLFLDGDGTSGAFSPATYDFTEPTDEADTARVQRLVDFTPDGGQGKLFIRARTVGDAQPVRIDIIDSMGLSTNILGLTKRFTNEWSVYTYDFTGNTGDAGFGGAEGCSVEEPCRLDMTAIQGIFIYPRPGEGMFTGQIEIDWVSVGQPLEEVMETAVGVLNYSDTLVGSAEFFTGTPAGITYAVSEDGFLNIRGDGTSSPFQTINYTLRDADGNAGKADAAGSGDKLYVRARILESESAVLRIDLIDEENFHTTNPSIAQTITGADYATYEYDYPEYTDGGFSGTACNTGPCPVDAQRITAMNFYPAPNSGMFSGELSINWVSFGQEISVNVADFTQLDRLRAFPNPTSDELGVEFDLPAASQVSLYLYDGLGRRVMVRDLGQTNAGNNFNRMDVSTLPTGTYHLQVVVNGAPARALTVLKQ